MIADEEYLTIQEVSDKIRMSESTIRRLINSGQLDRIYIGASSAAGVRVLASSVDAHLERRRKDALNCDQFGSIPSR